MRGFVVIFKSRLLEISTTILQLLFPPIRIYRKWGSKFDVDFIRLKIVDKKVAKRTAIQEMVMLPVRAYNHNIQIPGKKTERTVFALEKFTIPDGKQLIVELFEKNGGRHQSFIVESDDITRAKVINDLKVK